MWDHDKSQAQRPHVHSNILQADGVVMVQEYADGGDLLQLLMRSGARLSERTTVRVFI